LRDVQTSRHHRILKLDTVALQRRVSLIKTH